jgi:hypothetical protein
LDAYATTTEIPQKACRRSRSYSPRTPARYIRRSVRSISDDPARHGKSRRISEREALILWSQSLGLRFGKDFLSGYRFFGEGGEHRVYHDCANALAIKLTHPGSFGHSMHLNGCPATPSDYLIRLAWQNHIFRDCIKVTGTIGEKNVMQVVTCQPWIPTSRPATERQIADYLQQLRFEKFEINPGVPMYFHRYFKVVMADVHIGNILRHGGKLVPIDLVICKPDSQLRARIRELLGV